MSDGASPIMLFEEEIRDLIGVAEAREAVRGAFVSLARGEAILPAVLDIDLTDRRGEFHAKGAYLGGAEHFVIKTASGFFRNAEKGLPANSGLFLAFDAETGFLSAILLDNGFLTDIRTGAAGGLGVDLLAKKRVERVAMIGAGVQGRYQLEALLDVREPSAIAVYDVDEGKAAEYVTEMAAKGVAVHKAATEEEAIRGSDVIVTTTPSREPHLRFEWLSPGCHVTAMGADMPAKREVFPEVFAMADKVVVDRLSQCLTQGEFHYAVAEGAMKEEDVYAELGEIAAGMKAGRTSDTEITVVDLTGLGVQDAAVADFVVHAADEAGLGHRLADLQRRPA